VALVDLLPRNVTPEIRESLTGFRVVVVNGPRQSGKSTLLSLLADEVGGELLTLDDRTTLLSARTDPTGLVNDRERPLLIDEVQRGGDPLVLAVKAEVDRHPEKVGAFVISGSSRFLTVPTLSESLAGRARIIDLWPLSQGELAGRTESFIDTAFDSSADLGAVDAPVLSRAALFERVVKGGFPPILRLETPRQREAWFENYVRTLVERDLVEIRRIRQVGEVPDLIRLVAAWTAQELNVTTLARAAGLPERSVHDYLALLEVIYICHMVPNWASSFVAKGMRRPKIHAVDTGLACDALGIGVDALARPGNDAAGPLLETFVVNELSKQLGWSSTRAELRHFRDRDRREIDVILQARDGRVVAIEVKAARDVNQHDTRWLAWLREQLGDRFCHGVVLHIGERPRPLGDRITALPVSALWSL
jgi:predicted AAA+ superfamily ATPase